MEEKTRLIHSLLSGLHDAQQLHRCPLCGIYALSPSPMLGMTASCDSVQYTKPRWPENADSLVLPHSLLCKRFFFFFTQTFSLQYTCP